jgi:hypothetical protein
MTPHQDSGLDLPPSVPTPLLPQSPLLSEALQVCHPHAAGIAIGEAEHWVAVPPGGDPQPVRRFGTCTADLDAWADWLLDGGVTTVAMDSTGVYWIPRFELLEARGVQVLLLAPGKPSASLVDRSPTGSTVSGSNAYTLPGCSPGPSARPIRCACSAGPDVTARCC